MKTLLLDIQAVDKSFALGYGGRKNIFSAEQKNVISGLSLELEAGSLTALVGGNGAGKTTLFNIISGLLRPDKGKILFHGRERSIDCTRSMPWVIARGGVGRHFQGSRVFTELSVRDHLMIQARKTSKEWPFRSLLFPFRDKKEKEQLLEEVNEKFRDFDAFRDLLADGDKAASSLSFARQRLLSLGGLLLGDYDLLLLDEPTSGLNPESFETLYSFLEHLKVQGRSVFLIEHNMSFIRRAADVCHYVAEGNIRFSGPPQEILEREEVKQSYLL